MPGLAALAQVSQQVLNEARRSWRGLLALLLVIAGLKAARLAHLALALRHDVTALQALAGDPGPDTLTRAGPGVAAARHDLLALRAELAAPLWLSPLFGWLPQVGPDVAAAGRLLDMAANLMLAADEAFVALEPLMQSGLGEANQPSPEAVVRHLAAAQPRLQAAYRAASRAAQARADLPVEQLSPRVRALVERVDPLLPLARGGLAVAALAPDLLGARGPRTYLVLLQNQDEMRGSGGFISAVGTITVERGDITDMAIEDAYALDDLTKTYPAAPEPLQLYMQAPITLIRDSNWSPDFPTSAALAESLYNLTRGQRLDGVISVDQTAVRLFLAAIGPLTLAGAPEPITADNVTQFMRSAWSVEPGGEAGLDWWLHRKDFMKDLAAAMVDRLPSASMIDLGQAAVQALEERHILVRLRDRSGRRALSEQGWDGAVRPGSGDYLMVVESNLGFNKVNAIAQSRRTLEVDLSDLAAPAATLTVTDFNPAAGQPPCIHDPRLGYGDYQDMINGCYWNYLRVYTPARARLLDSTPHNVPGEWLMSGQTQPARVVTRAAENGAQSFETLLVVPFGETVATEFRYALAPGALTSWLGQHTYQLRVQKQPGALPAPFELRVRLPEGARFVGASPSGLWDGGVWRLDTLLAIDLDVRLTFRAP
jgi:hypothetical protein